MVAALVLYIASILFFWEKKIILLKQGLLLLPFNVEFTSEQMKPDEISSL